MKIFWIGQVLVQIVLNNRPVFSNLTIALYKSTSTFQSGITGNLLSLGYNTDPSELWQYDNQNVKLGAASATAGDRSDLPATGKKTVAVVVSEEDALGRRGEVLTISFVSGRPYSLEVPSQPAALTADGSAASSSVGGQRPFRAHRPHSLTCKLQSSTTDCGRRLFLVCHHSLTPSRPPASAHGGGSAAAMASGTCCLGWTQLHLPSGWTVFHLPSGVKVILAVASEING
jgi:hypothetical protein